MTKDLGVEIEIDEETVAKYLIAKYPGLYSGEILDYCFYFWTWRVIFSVRMKVKNTVMKIDSDLCRDNDEMMKDGEGWFTINHLAFREEVKRVTVNS